jgi:hypothetical protein
MGGAYGIMGKMRDAYMVLVGKSEGEWALGRYMRKLKENIKKSERNRTGIYELHWSGSGQGQFAELCADGNELRKFHKVQRISLPAQAVTYPKERQCPCQLFSSALRNTFRHFLRSREKCLLARHICMSVCLSVCLYICTYQRGVHWTDFHKILYWWLFYEHLSRYSKFE